MDIVLFFKAVALGVVVAAPVGPVAAMAISRSLAFGKRLGFFTGLGVALADALFALLAALGVSQVIDFISVHRNIIQLLGGIVLIIMGTHLFATARKVALQKTAKRVKTSVAVIGAFLIAITNPLTIFTFLAAFAEPSFGHIQNTSSALELTLGVFVGANLWWLFLVFGVTRFRHKIQGQALFWVNRILGILVVLLGLCMTLARFV